MSIYSVLLIIYSALFFYLCLHNLKWGIFWIVFTLPTYLIRFQIGHLPLTLLEAEIIILFLIWVVRGGLKDYRIRGLEKNNKNSLWLYGFMALLLITSFVSIFISPSLRSAAGLWKAYFLEPILFFVVFIKTIKKDDLKSVFIFLCFNVFLLSIFAIYQKFTGVFITNPFWAAAATRRVTSVFSYPNALALYLAPIIVVMLGVIVSKYQSIKVSKDKKFIVFFFLILVSCLPSLIAVYFTRSKGALLAIFAGLIFYTIFFKGLRKFFISLVCIIFIALLLYGFIAPVNFLNLLKGNPTVTGGDSISTRLDMWSETWQMLKTRPILGAGLAGYQTAVAPFHQKNYIEIYLYPHNIFLNFWSEVGLIGLLAFLGIVFCFYKTGFVCHPELDSGSHEIPDPPQVRGKQVRNDIRVILLAAMTTLLVHGLIDVPYFKNDLAILFWILVGAMVILPPKKEKENMNYKDIIKTVRQRLESAHDMKREHIRKYFFQSEYDFFKNHINDQKVLVAGSGLGHDSFELAKHNKEVVGVELINEYIEVANKNKQNNRLENIKFETGDFTKLRFEDNSFDCTVLNMGTISDFKNKKEIIEELLRVAKRIYFDFYPSTQEGVNKRKRMYEEERWNNVKVKGGVFTSDDGLYSESISKDEIKKIIDKMKLRVKFYDFCDIATMAEVEK